MNPISCRRFVQGSGILLLLLLPAAGCRHAVPAASASGAAGTGAQVSSALSLNEALRLSLANQVDAETVASLGKIAGEHINNSTLLRLPEICEESRAGTTRPPEVRLKLLDDAIAYNFVLSAPPGSDLEEERRPRVGQLLAFEGASDWAKLAAAREKIALSGPNCPPLLFQEEGDLRLELRMATGLTSDAIAQFSFDTLAKPRLLVCDLEELQRRAVRNRSESRLAGFSDRLPERVRQLPGMEGAEIPRLAELLYRLPRHLAELQLVDPNRDNRKLAAQGSAVGIAFEVELSLNRLRSAWDRFDLAQRKAGLNPESIASKLTLADARRDWRLAYYRLLTDLGVSDLTAPFKETDSANEAKKLPQKDGDALLDALRAAGGEAEP